jgi:hypothetical protein
MIENIETTLSSNKRTARVQIHVAVTNVTIVKIRVQIPLNYLWVPAKDAIVYYGTLSEDQVRSSLPALAFPEFLDIW